MVVGETHHFRKPPYDNIMLATDQLTNLHHTLPLFFQKSPVEGSCFLRCRYLVVGEPL